MSATTTGDGVKVFCWLDGFYPKAIQVKWYEGNKPFNDTAIEKLFQASGSSSNAYSLLSEIKTSKQKWDENTEFKCEAEHKSKTVDKKWSMCKEYQTHKPLIRLEKPSLTSILAEENAKAIASCVVETALKPEVSWFTENNEKLDGANIYRLRERTVSNLTIKIEDWNKWETLTCMAEHPCFTKAEIKIIVKEPVKKTPTVVIRRSFTDTGSKEGIELECVARDLPSSELFITFHSSSGMILNTQDVKLPENMDTLTARAAIPKDHQISNNTFSCQIQQSHSEKWNSNYTGKLFDEPSVEVSAVPSKDGSTSQTQKLLCIGTGFNPQIKWISKPESKDIKEERMQADGRVKVISENTVQQQVWSSGVNFKCEVRDQDSSKLVEQSISFCAAHSISKPLMRLEKPPIRSLLGEKPVIASCVVETALEPQVSWFKGNTKVDGASIYKQSERTVSNLTINMNEWKTLQTLTCKAEHPCFTKAEIKINLKESVKKTPTVVIRRSFTDTGSKEGIELECVARDLPSGELVVTFQSSIDKGTFDTQDVKLPENMDTLTARAAIPKDHQTPHNTFSCQIQQSHSEKWNSKPTGKLFDEPSVEVSAVPSKDGSTSQTQKLLCIGTGFNPQIKWDPRPESKDIKEERMQADGRVKVMSENTVQQQVWNSGVNFKCEVRDQDSSKLVEQSISVCSAFPDFVQVPQVYLLANSIGDSKAKDGISATCLLLGHRLEDFTITWRIGTNYTPSDVRPQKPKVHSNGTESFESVQKVPHAKWNAFESISCEVKHPCLKFPQLHTISKTKDPKIPTVRIFSPRDKDLSGEHDKSLVCFIDGFYPADISVHWELNNHELSRFTNGSVSGPSASGTYSMHSVLTLTGSTNKNDVFSCVVKHESSENQISDKIANIYASVIESPPSMDLLQDKDQLVCVVHGYSPSAINITWLLNSVAVHHMDNNNASAKRHDGKFMISSHLKVRASEWTPGHTYTCLVDHVTGIKSLNITKTEFIEKTIYFDENKSEAITVDQAEETWNMACAFIILFIITLFYGCSVTLVKVKGN